MIFSFWQEHLDEFLDSMCEQGFCTKVISAHKRFALSLEEDATVHGWQTYEDVRNYYSLLPGLKDKTRWFKLSIIKKLEAFHLLGQKPEHRIVKEHVHVTAPTRSKGRLNLFPLCDQLDDSSLFLFSRDAVMKLYYPSAGQSLTLSQCPPLTHGIPIKISKIGISRKNLQPSTLIKYTGLLTIWSTGS